MKFTCLKEKILLGYDVENEITKLNIEKIFSSLEVNFNAYPIISGKDILDIKHKVFNPSDLSQCIGEVAFSSQSTIEAINRYCFIIFSCLEKF